MFRGNMFRRLLYISFRGVFYINRWIRERFTPLGLLLIGAMIMAGIFGVDLKSTLSYQLFTLTAALILVAIIASLHFKGRFKAQRLLPEYGTAGEALHYRIRLNNIDNKMQKALIILDQLENPFPTYEEYRDSHDPKDKIRNWFDRLIGYPRLMGIMQRKTGATTEAVQLQTALTAVAEELTVTLKPLRRGYIRFTDITIARPDPLGIYKNIKKLPHPGSLLILPRTYRIPSIHLFGNRKYQPGGITRASSVGDSQEFLSLRDYRPGDPLRAIHWRSFAKLGKPIVREYQDEFFVRQALLLDTWLDDQPEVIFEEAVSLAASFTLASFDTDSLLDLLFVGTKSFHFTTGRGVSQPENMLEILACVKPCSEPAFAIMQNLVLERCAKSSGLICILLDWTEERQALIRKAMQMAIPVYVFLIRTETEAGQIDYGPLAEHPERFTVIPIDNIQPTLNTLML